MTVAPRTPPGPPSPTGYSSALTAVVFTGMRQNHLGLHYYVFHDQVVGCPPNLHPLHQPGHQLELAAAQADAAGREF